jgi:hypothetical protein
MEFLATPLIIHAEMDEAAFRYELARMQARQAATAEFVAGEIEVDDFFDMLQDSGVNVDNALKSWSSGQSYMS